VLALTEMGQIKQQLYAEAEADGATSGWRDEVSSPAPPAKGS